jgi:hypothetical protein
MTKTTVQLLWKDCKIESRFRAGVSLHSHTLLSEESMHPVSQQLFRLPYLGPRVCNDPGLDFAHAFWTPPLSARRAYRLEEKQIHRCLQLRAFVSLTDHDDIRAGTLLRVLDRFREAPISTEWTVQFESTFFHLGVHNIPPSSARAIADELTLLSARSDGKQLAGILTLLNAFPDILIVLNHPLWDEKGLGPALHAEALRRLLERHRKSIHALEVNGLRPWRENTQVMRLGLELDLPVVSGGDRHGLEANSILNLSAADTFAEFIHEVRDGGRSHVVFMSQYREPRRLRILRMIADVLREYPDMPGRETWTDRVYVRKHGNSDPEPLSSFLDRSNAFPIVVNALGSVLQASRWRGVRWAFGRALRGGRSA